MSKSMREMLAERASQAATEVVQAVQPQHTNIQPVHASTALSSNSYFTLNNIAIGVGIIIGLLVIRALLRANQLLEIQTRNAEANIQNVPPTPSRRLNGSGSLSFDDAMDDYSPLDGAIEPQTPAGQVARARTGQTVARRRRPAEGFPPETPSQRYNIKSLAPDTISKNGRVRKGTQVLSPSRF